MAKKEFEELDSFATANLTKGKCTVCVSKHRTLIDYGLTKHPSRSVAAYLIKKGYEIPSGVVSVDAYQKKLNRHFEQCLGEPK